MIQYVVGGSLTPYNNNKVYLVGIVYNILTIPPLHLLELIPYRTAIAATSR